MKEITDLLTAFGIALLIMGSAVGLTLFILHILFRE